MNKQLKGTKEFCETFLQTIGENKPSYIEYLENRQLRIKLIFEELTELAEAGDVKGTLSDLCSEYSKGAGWLTFDGDNVDKVEELDAIIDLLYVVNGKAVSGGYSDLVDAAFNLVHKNNMSKAHRSVEHAMETSKIKKLSDPTTISRVIGTDMQVLLYEKGKLIKPHDFEPVDLAHLINT